MYVEEVTQNVNNIKNAFATIATLLQLTSNLYPVEQNVTNGATFDYIVVGAGTAGSVVASRLVEDPNVSVLLIEAGGNPPIECLPPNLGIYTLKTRMDWNHTSQMDKEAYQCFQNNRLHIIHGKVLGGTSSINSLQYARGDPQDYNNWATITGDASWNYTNVLPYFKKSERLEVLSILNSPYAKFHGTNGNMGVTRLDHEDAQTYLDSLKELGKNINLDTNSDYTLGFNQVNLAVDDGIRQGAANAFLSKLRERANLHVMIDSLVTKIIIDKKNVARGVIITNSNEQVITVNARKEVIVSAGAINNPQLLMLSGVGPKNTLEKFNIKTVADLPVGANLQDHISGSIYIKMGKTNTKNKMGVTGFVSMNESQKYPDYEVTLVLANDKAAVKSCSNLYFYKNNICQDLYEGANGNDVMSINIYTLDTTPKGYVSLKSLNAKDSPLIFMNTFPDDNDLEKFISYIEDITRIVNTTYFKSVNAEVVKLPICSDFVVGTKDYWRCYLRCLGRTGLHFSSTCGMGSVVDSRLRVRKVARLRVVDASIMPAIVRGNPMTPTIMIAEKAADMIKEDNGLSSRAWPTPLVWLKPPVWPMFPAWLTSSV